MAAKNREGAAGQEIRADKPGAGAAQGHETGEPKKVQGPPRGQNVARVEGNGASYKPVQGPPRGQRMDEVLGAKANMNAPPRGQGKR